VSLQYLPTTQLPNLTTARLLVVSAKDMKYNQEVTLGITQAWLLHYLMLNLSTVHTTFDDEFNLVIWQVEYVMSKSSKLYIIQNNYLLCRRTYKIRIPFVLNCKFSIHPYFSSDALLPTKAATMHVPPNSVLFCSQYSVVVLYTGMIAALHLTKKLFTLTFLMYLLLPFYTIYSKFL